MLVRITIKHSLFTPLTYATLWWLDHAVYFTLGAVTGAAALGAANAIMTVLGER